MLRWIFLFVCAFPLLSQAADQHLRLNPRACASQMTEVEELPYADDELTDEEVQAILSRLEAEVEAEIQAGVRARYTPETATAAAAEPLHQGRFARAKRIAGAALLGTAILIANPIGREIIIPLILNHFDPIPPINGNPPGPGAEGD